MREQKNRFWWAKNELEKKQIVSELGERKEFWKLLEHFALDPYMPSQELGHEIQLLMEKISESQTDALKNDVRDDDFEEHA